MTRHSSLNPQEAMLKYQYCIKRIEITSTKKVKSDTWAQLLVDGEVVHKLASITKGQPLIWDEPLYCNANSNTVTNFQIYQESYLWLQPILIGSIELSTSEIPIKASTQSIDRTETYRASKTISVSFKFLNSSPLLAAFKTVMTFVTAAIKLSPTVADTTLALCQVAHQELEAKFGYTEDIEKLIVGFADILQSVHPVTEHGCSTNLINAVTGILELIQHISAFIMDFTSAVEATQIESTFLSSSRIKVQDFLQQLKDLTDKFDQQLHEQAHFDWMNEALHQSKLVAHSTHHDSCGCLPGTRTMIFSDIDAWIGQDPANDRLLWINGPSGIGKSSIATSVCRSLETRGMLGASFFCKWDDPELRDPVLVMSSIVYRLTGHCLIYRELVASTIHSDPELHIPSLRITYERLVRMPLMTMADSGMAQDPMCIVIDALDECGTCDNRIELLSYLYSMSQLVPWLKVIVTTLPDQNILGFFRSTAEGSVKVMDVCKYDASNDIAAYIRARISVETSSSFRLDNASVASLAELAGGLFIWADIACRFILEFNPQGRLAEVLTHLAICDVPSKLDPLYAIILENALRDICEDDAPKQCLEMIITTGFRSPLSIDTLQWLMAPHIRSRALPVLVEALSPVLYEDRSNNKRGIVRAYHRSFIDYITTESRSKDFYIDLAKQDAILSTFCLITMRGELKFNICSLKTSYMPNRNVPGLESRVRSAIRPHLSYSCLWWINHIMAADPTNIDMATLKEFLFGQALVYWIEALSLMDKLDIAVSKLPMFTAWARTASQKYPDLIEVSECARDVYKFITSFYDVISESTPHLYLSALPFAPADSSIAQRGRVWFPSTVRLRAGSEKNWSPCLKSMSYSGSILCLALSPDEATLASGSSDNTVQLWDVETGGRLFELVGHSDCIWAVSFSPDGCRIASSSHDKTVRVWDARTGGKVLEPLVGHTGPVLSVAFSYDGRYIASGSHDKTVRVWNAETGTETYTPLFGHSGPVLSVAFSPTDYRIASGSFDKTARIWESETGASLQLIGHSGWVLSVSFCPKARRIISGSYDKTIRIWDVETGKQMLDPIIGHAGPVNSVALSPDGLRIVSGSNDNTMRVWDSETGTELFGPLVGHSNYVLSALFFSDGERIVSGSCDHTMRVWHIETVKPPIDSKLFVAPSSPSRRFISDDTMMWLSATETSGKATISLVGHSDTVFSVAFSPNGRRIISGSKDNTIQIWDTETGAEVSAPLIGHSDWVFSVAFSPDGRRIVSSSKDNTIRMWDSETGAVLFAPLVGHSDWIYSLALSPDGQRIVSGSMDCTVQMWDAGTGTKAFDPYAGHSGSVLSVAFSPDGRRIVSCAKDNTIRMWDAETGAAVSSPLVSCSAGVNAVAFSPDGRRIVSGSHDTTVRMWDAETGTEASTPLVGHSSWVWSVAFSPDGRYIVSGSHDKTVRMWDAETGTQASEPLVGHSGAVWSVAFSPDGRRIVSGSEDKTVRIWDVDYHLATFGSPFSISYLFRFMRTTGWVSPDGKPFLLWIPSGYRGSEGGDSPSTRTSTQRIPPSARIDFSRFVHGTEWASVAAA